MYKVKMRESKLEKYLKDYVYDKTAESVYLHLEDAIMISHITQKGSITLAILWANILQHPSNFPPEHFQYSKFFDSPTGGDRLIVKAEGVIFTVFMASGTIVMEGKHIYDWFVKRFKDLLDNYDGSFQHTWTFIPTSSLSVATEVQEISRYQPETDTEKYLLLMTGRHAEGTTLDRKMAEHADDLIPGLGNMNMDQTLYEGEELDKETYSLHYGAVKDGFTYVYKLWKSLLHRWLADIDTKVYIVNPELDTQRLCDIVDLNITHQYRGSLEVIYTNMDCDKNNANSAEDLKRIVLDKYDEKHRTYVEYKVLNRIMFPLKRTNARFIAAVKDHLAEVLITSAGFQGRNFLHESMETVVYMTMREDTFIKQFVDPIGSVVVASTY